MVKQTFGFLLSATLLVASGSFARADNFSITSDWHTGFAQFGDLVTFTGNGSFTYNTITGAFSNIVFTFNETSPTSKIDWTATSGDGLFLTGSNKLELGDGTQDCNGSDCVSIFLTGALGSSPTLAGTTGFEQGSTTQGGQPTFDDALVTDTSSVPEPTSVLLLLTAVLGAGFALRKKLRGVAPTVES